MSSRLQANRNLGSFHSKSRVHEVAREVEVEVEVEEVGDQVSEVAEEEKSLTLSRSSDDR